MKTMCSTSLMVRVRLFAGIARARAMLAEKDAAAAAVVRSFRKSRRSWLIGRSHLSGTRIAIIARARVVPGHCGLVIGKLRLCYLAGLFDSPAGPNCLQALRQQNSQV